MPLYSATVSATSNGSANTEDTFIEVLAASGSALSLRRVKVYSSTAAADTVIRGRIIRASSAGATGTAGTATKVVDSMRASSATVVVKNGTNAFSTGSVVDTIERFCINGRSVWEWVPASAEERVTNAAASYLKLIIENSGTSQVVVATLTWED